MTANWQWWDSSTNYFHSVPVSFFLNLWKNIFVTKSFIKNQG